MEIWTCFHLSTLYITLAVPCNKSLRAWVSRATVPSHALLSLLYLYPAGQVPGPPSVLSWHSYPPWVLRQNSLVRSQSSVCSSHSLMSAKGGVVDRKRRVKGFTRPLTAAVMSGHSPPLVNSLSTHNLCCYYTITHNLCCYYTVKALQICCYGIFEGPLRSGCVMATQVMSDRVIATQVMSGEGVQQRWWVVHSPPPIWVVV